MVDSYKAKPFEERESQTVGLRGYCKEIAIAMLPFAAATGAILFGKFTKQSIMPLDGTPDLLTKLQKFLVNHSSTRIAGEKLITDQVEVTPFIHIIGKTYEDKLRFSQHYFNALKGFEFGSIPVIYHVWKQKEAKRLDLTSSYDSLKQLESLKPTDDELRAENASLKQQLEYVTGKSHTEAHTLHAEAHDKPHSTLQLDDAEYHGRTNQHTSHREHA